MTKERYVRFGERIGAVQSLALAREDAPPALRNAIWNGVESLWFAHLDRGGYRARAVRAEDFVYRMAYDKDWVADQYRLDEYQALDFVRKWVTEKAKWWEVYELIERFPNWGNLADSRKQYWEVQVNQILLDARSPWRFVNHQLSELTSDQERAEVGEASAQVGKYALAAEHIAKALTKLSARPAPDYENACKEAALAVEAALNTANGKTLKVGDAVRAFVKTHSAHPALMESASNLFGYASDRDGVRHASKGTTDPVDFAEAKLVIVAASGWVNFIAAKAP